jgi:putative phosphoesterase
MSKLGVIADIHGDIVALRRAWGFLEDLGVCRVACAGDLVGYGPEPDQVVRFIAERGVATARGNHDLWAADRPAGKPDRFGGPAIGSTERAFLQGLPPLLMLSVAGRFVAVMHSPPDHRALRCRPDAVILGELRAYLDLIGASVLVLGHAHEPFWHRAKDRLIVNPGSLAALPAVRSSRTFAVIDLKALDVTFHDAVTGRVVDVPELEACH